MRGSKDLDRVHGDELLLLRYYILEQQLFYKKEKHLAKAYCIFFALIIQYMGRNFLYKNTIF